MKLEKNCAKHLLSIKAVELRPTQPFTWTSGLKSPIYCDNRKTLSYPQLRTFIKEGMVHIIKQYFADTEVIAGVATGAIAIGALVAETLGLPFIYIRSEEKKHGLTNLIEGVLQEGQKVVVIEDLISTGKSSLKAANAVQDAGAKVLGMVAIFSYLLPIAEEQFKNVDFQLFTLTNYDILIQQAVEENYIQPSELETLAKWRENPAKWAEQFN
ncbi:MAG: orotate phosphoribosyltransferase [Bacteroidales bacterium]|jgi:orotate phosphoribosyltransferase|nr:orotate phosphoribosyltransferase [Bacteroidales bacterium]